MYLADRYDIDLPIAVLVGDDVGRLEEAHAACEAGGMRPARWVGLDEAVESLALQARLDAVLVEAQSADPDALFAHLPRLDALALERGVALVVAIDDAQIDLAWPLVSQHTALLCEPDRHDRVAALAHRRMRPTVLHEVTGDDRERLILLNQEVARIAETLARLTRQRSADPIEPAIDGMADAEGAMAQPPVTVAEVRSVIRLRRLREAFFKAEYFADPAWDMLLDLYASEIEHRRVSVSSLCIASAVPGTTALRWIGTMIDAGVFERRDDPFDRRRAYVSLGAEASAAMSRYFQAVRGQGTLVS